MRLEPCRPGHLRTMTAIWMDPDSVRAALASRRTMLTGNRQLTTAMQTWLGLSFEGRGDQVARAIAGTQSIGLKPVDFTSSLQRSASDRIN